MEGAKAGSFLPPFPPHSGYGAAAAAGGGKDSVMYMCVYTRPRVHIVQYGKSKTSWGPPQELSG